MKKIMRFLTALVVLHAIVRKNPARELMHDETLELCKRRARGAMIQANALMELL